MENTMSTKKHFFSGKMKAQGVVEFALVLTLLLMIIYGILEVGRLIFIDSIVVTAAREAARYGSATGVVPGTNQYKDCDGIIASAKRVDFLNVINVADIHIRYITDTGSSDAASLAGMTTCPPSAAIKSGYRIRVDVSTSFVPLEGLVPLRPMTLRSSNVRTLLGSVDVAAAAVQPPPEYPVLTVYLESLGRGTVISVPAGINCVKDTNSSKFCKMDTSFDQNILLTADADDATSTFAGWVGCASNPTPTQCRVSMDKSRAVIAFFDSLTGKRLTVSKTGWGTGDITSDLDGIDCGLDCTEQFEAGTIVTVFITPHPASSSTLSKVWVNGDDTVCPIDPSSPIGPGVTFSCAVTMDVDTLVEAQFDSPVKKLTVIKTGFGVGTVTAAPPGNPGINCGAVCNSDFDNGTVVTLTAVPTPSSGSEWTAWSGCDTTGVDAGGKHTCTVGMTYARFVYVNFDSPTKKTLTVTKPDDNTGDGTVSSSPVGPNGGIYCGPTCADAFNVNTAVRLTATSDDTSKFLGWGGACSGLGVCTVTMNTAKFVTANFEHAAPPPCVFAWMTPVWESSPKTITWNIQNTIPGSSVEIDRLLIFFGGDNLQRVALDGTAIWTGDESPVGLSIPGNGRTIGFGNHAIVFTYPKPNAIVGKNFSATLYLKPGNCNMPSTGSWTVK
jgi:Flp pilus assembly protein TadG